LTGKAVTVIPAITVPQGVAALVACRFEEDLPANARYMNAAMESVRTLEIARPRSGRTVPTPGETDGRVIGLLDGAAATPLDEPVSVMERLLSLLDPGGVEVITLYYGEAGAALVEKTREVFRRILPHAAVETVDGGQRDPPLIISVE
jgi:dihydroxyacetone kinase-like predicted kinase